MTVSNDGGGRRVGPKRQWLWMPMPVVGSVGYLPAVGVRITILGHFGFALPKPSCSSFLRRWQ